ncbi:MAG: hypothetical protein ACRDHO_15135 [Actinomycetota bacterium]
MRIRRLITRSVVQGRASRRLAGGVHAAVAASVNEPKRTRTRVSTRQRLRVVQGGNNNAELIEQEIVTDEDAADERS